MNTPANRLLCGWMGDPAGTPPANGRPHLIGRSALAVTMLLVLAAGKAVREEIIKAVDELSLSWLLIR